MKRVVWCCGISLLFVSMLVNAQDEFSYIENRSADGLDPITYSSNSVNDRLASLLYSYLYSIDNEPKPVPDLVEKYEQVPSKLNTYILTLHKGLKWSNGEEVTVDDIIKTIEIIRNPKSKNNADVYLPKRLGRIKSYSRKDKYSFEISFNSSLSTTEWQSLLHFPILPKKVLGSLDAMTRNNPLASAPVGCGPFYFTQFLGEYVIMRRNPDYQRIPAAANPSPIQKVTMIANAEDVSKVEFFKSGRVSMLVEVPWKNLKEVENLQSQFETWPYQSLSYYYLGFNFRNEVLKIPAVREACSKAINRQRILSAIYYGHGDQMHGPFPPASPYFNVNVLPDPYDKEAAIAVLKGAGFVDSNNDGVVEYRGRPVSFRLTYVQAKGSLGDTYQQVAEHILGDLAEIGIKVNLDPQQYAKYEEILFDRHDFDMSLAKWQFADLEGDCSTLFLAKDTVKGANNYIKYINDDITSLFDTFEKAADEESRKDLGREIDKRMAMERPYAFLWSLHNVTAWDRKRYSNISINPFSFFDTITEWQIVNGQ